MKYIVTGGGGFVGKALCLRLKAAGHEVHSLARGAYPELLEAGICHHRVDLSGDLSALAPVFEGSNALFHVAAKVEMWGRFEDFFAVNVQATRNLLLLCKSCGVKNFVFTSSPSVVADGKDLCGVDESQPYPEHFEAYYPQTKALAEQEVLAMHGVSGFKTIALRPHLIFGPGDTNLVPTILERGRRGRLVQVGNGENLSDFTFIEDCVEAHIRAAEALESNPNAGGRAYFITQGEPANMWGWINEVLARNGVPPIKRRVPVAVARALGGVSELLVQILPGEREPFLTRFLVSEMATSHYFSIEAAKRELGYLPRYTMREAMDITFGNEWGDKGANLIASKLSESAAVH